MLDALNVFELIQDGVKVGYSPKFERVFTKFPGFDGNNESKLMVYSKHLVEYEHRFEYVERKDNRFNSRFPMIEFYQRIISAWERLERPHLITEELFDSLIAAQRHPDALADTATL